MAGTAQAVEDNGKAIATVVVVVGGVVLPGPEDVLLAAILGKHGLKMGLQGGKYILRRGDDIIDATEEADLLRKIRTELMDKRRSTGGDRGHCTFKWGVEPLARRESAEIEMLEVPRR